jgi:signal peptidase
MPGRKKPRKKRRIPRKKRIVNGLQNGVFIISEEKETAAKQSVGYRVAEVLGRIFIYILAACIVIAALIFAADKSPQKSLFGYRYYTVLTPSMEPELSVGDVVIVKLANADSISVGDVITFNPSSDSDAYLTHRVTQKFDDYEGTGVTCFRTKGDANDSEDSFLIDSERVIGTVSTHIPKIGYIIRFVQLRWYFVVPLAVMILIFFKLIKIYLRSGDEQDHEDKSADYKTAAAEQT